MLGKYWVPSRENLVTAIEHLCVKQSLTYSFSVVVDATNLREGAWESKYLNHGINPTYKDFTDVSLETCIERDKLRTGDDHVGEEVIRNMYNKYLKK